MTSPEQITYKILDRPEEMEQVEALQLGVWPGSELDVVPAHLLLTLAHNGGLVIGAYDEDHLAGFVFGFLGLRAGADNRQLKFCSHMLGVLPEYRSAGVAFRLKRAQWQMVRKMGVEVITWTYDPLLSANGNLNIAKLGAVSDTYRRTVYGQMRDSLNVGLPSDRLQVDWWLNSQRVYRRLSSKPRMRLDLAHFLAAESQTANKTVLDANGWPVPTQDVFELPADAHEHPTFLLVEIPSDFLALKAADRALALEWRLHSRAVLETLFENGYLITDFVYLSGRHPRSYYVLSRGDSTLGA